MGRWDGWKSPPKFLIHKEAKPFSKLFFFFFIPKMKALFLETQSSQQLAQAHTRPEINP